MAGINFRGKSAVQNHHLAVPYRELLPVADKSVTVTPSLDDNLIIHGDNLESLKALLPTHAGGVYRVYIDPPYNTGNQKSENWVYNDRVDSPLVRDWLGKEVGRDDLTRHDKWLCMMMPRLQLLRELLAVNGLIFISIDWTEVHGLRLLMDEVFGEDNFIALLTWKGMHSRRNSAHDFSQDTEYVMVFARDKGSLTTENDFTTYIREPADKSSNYPYDSDDGNGLFKLDPLHSRNYAKPYHHTFANGVKWTAPKGRYPSYSVETLTQKEASGEVVFKGDTLRRKDGTTTVYGGKDPSGKTFLNRTKEGLSPRTLLPAEVVGYTKDGTSELADLFAGEKVFNQPKPTSLVKYLLSLERPCDNSTKGQIILDSFAGSGTTGQAVLEMNQADGRERRFILVEMEDYADTVTAERVRRRIGGLPDSPRAEYRTGTPGGFTFLELGDRLDVTSLLVDESLPSFADLARYVFFTATGQTIKDEDVDEKTGFIGETDRYRVHMLYDADRDVLRTLALTLDRARQLSADADKTVLVFAPTKYMDAEQMRDLNVEFCQLPFDIFRVKA